MAANRPLPDAASRNAIENDLDTTMMVEAAAGTGKTTSLVRRMVALLRRRKTTIERMAAITYTRKAAAHLREKFQIELEGALKRATEPSERETFQSALGQLHQCFIGTVHSFCARLLRERPVEAGVDPDFQELDDLEDGLMRSRFWGEYCQRLFINNEPALSRLSKVGVNPRDLEQSFVNVSDYLDVAPVVAGNLEPPDLSQSRESVLQFLRDAREQLPNEVPAKGWDSLQTLVKRGLRLSRLLDHNQAPECVRLLQAFETDAGPVQKKWLDRKRAKALGQRFIALRDNVVMPALLRWREYLHPILFALIQPAVHQLQRQRVTSGQLNYEDLLLLARDLLAGTASVRDYFQKRFTHLLVDEFQDTDPIQAEIIVRLTAEAGPEADWRKMRPRPGSLFIVGDPKQSIYRFRRADITTYGQMKEVVRQAGGKVIRITTNFRSLSNVCEWVNTAFKDTLPPQDTPHQAAFVPINPSRLKDPKHGGVFKLVTAAPRTTNAAVAALNAGLIGDWVLGAINGGWKITVEGEDGGTKHRDVQPGDVMVILRGRKNLTLYARAFEERGIPYELSGGKGFAESEELRWLLDFLKAVIDPDDPVSLLAYLRGPLCGVDDNTLYGFKQAGGRFCYLSNPPDGMDSRIIRAFEFLREARTWVRKFSPAVALARSMEALGIIAHAGSLELGETRSGNLLKALLLARTQSSEGGSIVDLVHELESLMEGFDTESMSSQPGRANAVRLMNLHKAKGLEAQIVFLADPTDPFDHPPEFHISREADPAQGYFLLARREGYQSLELARPLDWDAKAESERLFKDAEEDRLLYVAATRAKNVLVVSVHLQQNKDADRELGPWLKFIPHIRRKLPSIPSPQVISPVSPGPGLITELDGFRTSLATRKADVCRPTDLVTHVTKEAHAEGEFKGQRGGLGPEWGVAVHRMLEMRMRSPGIDPGRCAEYILKEIGLPLERKADLFNAAATVENSDLWQRALRSNHRLTEVPFSIKVPAAELGRNDGPAECILNGTIDLAFQEDGRWVLVDYKTDKVDGDGAALVEFYRAQIEMYARYWQRISGMEARAALFFIDIQKASWI